MSATQQAVTDTACSVFQDHGGSLFEQSFPSTLGCATAPGFRRSAFTVWNTGAGDCNAVGWASSDVHDGHVNVIIKNSGGFLSGTCHVTVTEDSEPCGHDRCSTGGALIAACDSCATQICAVDAFCCNNTWDSICVGEVRSVCNSLACDSPPCPHAECTVGAAMTSTCSSSVSLICGRDPYCCTTAWDSICVGEVASVAGKNCN
ncbi:MAG TPA: hypothetical protein VF469_30050 [Kofleriaceae bacterium]